MENEGKNKKIKFIMIGIVCSILIIIAVLLFISNRKVTVKFDTIGGSIVQNEKVKYNNKIERPSNPTREGYVFDNWYYGDEVFDFNTKITSNIVLKAKWKEEEKAEIFSINFDDDNGKSIKVVKVRANEKISKPSNPTREGYKFIGWQYNGQDFDFSTKVTEDITLIAKWEKIEENTNSNSNESNNPSTQVPNNNNQSSGSNNQSSGGNNNQSNPTPTPEPPSEVQITYSVISSRVEGSAMSEYLYQIKGSDGNFYNGTIEFTLSGNEKITREVTTSGIKYPSTLVEGVRYISVNS